MNILHTVEFYHPSTGGAQEVVRQISERLARRGHSVTVATTRMEERASATLNGVRIEGFDISGNLVRGIAGERERYLDLLRASEFDVMMNYAAQSWPTDLAFPILHEIGMRKVFVPCGFSGLHIPEYADYYRSMGSWMKAYDACVFLSENYRDVDLARRSGIDRNVLIPNGAGENEFTVSEEGIREKLAIPEDHLLILHVGSHTGMKGHRELMSMFRRASTGPATLLIVANDFGRGCGRRCALSQRLLSSGLDPLMRGKQVIVTPLSRKDTVSAYHEADLFLFPSNIECSPIVLFEAMASRTPFLTTDVGNSLEIIKWSGGGVALPTVKTKEGFSRAEIRGSVRALEELIHDEARRKELGQNG